MKLVSLKTSINSSAILLLVLTLFLTTGCQPETDFTYGKSYDKSTNGLSVFANLLRERGHKVNRKRRLTKRLHKFDTIVWAPDNEYHPPEDVCAWIEEWLSKGDPKVLIYIGRSYDARIPYFEGMVANASVEQQESWQRELADILLRDREFDFFVGIGPTATQEPFWYKKSEDNRLDTNKLEGQWSDGVDPELADLDCRTLLAPLDDYNDEKTTPFAAFDEDADEFIDQYEYDYDYGYYMEDFRESEMDVKKLLTVDGKPFAFEISASASPGRRLIVISNGSFLLNYPLLNREHQQLASNVADEVVGDVVFLESAGTWPRIGGGANDPALHWSWVAKAPMNYIVPHFLFWGVLYCFVFFPNFGRPKRIQFHPPKAFRSHVKAVASILGRSKEKHWAREMVDMWLKRNNQTKN